MKDFLSRALVSGTVAAAAVTVAASLVSRRTTQSYPAAINATSHVLRPGRAERQDEYSWEYTGTGIAINCGASIFWALVYEAIAPRRDRESRVEAVLRGLGVAALAYVTDYHVVPKRLKPGFELRLPRLALVPIYAALALGLSLRDLVRR